MRGNEDPTERMTRKTERMDEFISSAVDSGRVSETTHLPREEVDEDSSDNDNRRRGLEEVNEVMKNLSNDGRKNRLNEFARGEADYEEFGFDGFVTGLAKKAEEYLVDLANTEEIEGDRYRFGEDKGTVKTATGYTLGAKPREEIESEEYDSLKEVPEPELEALGEAIATVTEKQVMEDSRGGKYLEAFQLYAETDMNQKEIAEEVGVDQASLSRRKSEWEDRGLVEDRKYTEAGEALSEMIEEIYSVR